MVSESNIQLLVDGELSAQQRADLVRQLGADPESWRRVATAFMHQQLVQQSIHQWMDSREPGQPFVRSKDSNHASRNIARVDKPRQPVVAGGLHWHLALALVVVALLGGYWVGSARFSESTGLIASPRNHLGVNYEPLNQPDSRMGLEEALARCLTPVPQTFRRELLRAGYWLDEGYRVAKVDLPMGGTLEMPVRQFDIHYLGDAAFQ